MHDYERRERSIAWGMARIDVPKGPGGDAAMVWSLRPEMAGMVNRMIATAYEHSVIPPNEREVARMRIAELNACIACATFRAPAMLAAGVTEDEYRHVAQWRDWPGYSARQRLAIEFAERFATAHHTIDDAFMAKVRSEFADAEVLDLTLCCAVYVGLGRTLEVLGIVEGAAPDN
jgi:AhpD family alkylhydroperoxidase